MSSNVGKSLMRSTKNLVKGYSDVQVKVREATSNDPDFPSQMLMQEIAQSTYNHRDFMDIMEILDKRLNDHGKYWRHVFKSLGLLDYLLHFGSEAVIAYAKENLYVVRTLGEFQYMEDGGKDYGANVRQKAKEITALLADEDRLREERRKANPSGYGNAGYGGYGYQQDPYSPAPSTPVVDNTYRPPPPPTNDQDLELQQALEESRRTHAEEARRRNNVQDEYDDDEELQRALRLSEMEARKDEERRRQRMLQEQQMREQRQLEEDLFGLSSAFQNQNQYGYNQQPQQQYDPFGSIAQDGFGDNFSGQWANPFGSGFDGGANARTLPHQLARGTANAQVAEIARNAAQIDPFASLAQSRSNAAPSPATFTPNPEPPAPVIRPTISGANTMAFKPASRFTPTVNISSNPTSANTYTGNYNAPTNSNNFNSTSTNRELVNLSAQALTPQSNQSKNPFAPQPNAFEEDVFAPPQQQQAWGTSSSNNPFASGSNSFL